MARVLVTLCTYNERENLVALIPEIRRTLPEADVLVVDDGSPDGTGALADELAATDPHVPFGSRHRAGCRQRSRPDRVVAQHPEQHARRDGRDRR